MLHSEVEPATKLEMLHTGLEQSPGWEYLGVHRGTLTWRFRYPYWDGIVEGPPPHVLLKAKASDKRFEVKLSLVGAGKRYPCYVMTEAWDVFTVQRSIENWVHGMFPDTMPCEAWKDPRQRQERCEAPSEFIVARVVDSDLNLCRYHLGPVLAEGHNVSWPPEIIWTGAGPFPRNAILPTEEADLCEQRHNDLWADDTDE